MDLRSIGDRFAEASELIRTAFGTNKEVALDYNADFVRSAYDYPGVDTELTPAYFEDGSMISVLASFPRRVLVDGVERKLALLTWNSVHPSFRHLGLGIENVFHGVQRARDAGYDGTLFYCSDGSPANRTSSAGVRMAKLPCPHVFTANYLMGMIPAKARETPPPASLDPVGTFQRLSCQLAVRRGLIRVFDAAEAAWECIHRHGAVTEVLQEESGAGMLTGYVLEDVARTPYLFVESILWEELTPATRILLLRRFLERVAGRARFAVVPLMNYADMEPFKVAGFRRALRRLNAYVTIWNGPQPESPESMYIDVF